jgi:hypothetical protein
MISEAIEYTEYTESTISFETSTSVSDGPVFKCDFDGDDHQCGDFEISNSFNLGSKTYFYSSGIAITDVSSISE